MSANVEDRPGSVSRPSRVFDGVLAVALAALLVVGTYFASQGQHQRRPLDAGTVALVVVAAAALAWRRRFPVPVLGVVFGAALVYFVLGYANGPIWLALIIAYFSAVVAGHRLAAAVVAVLGFGIFPWLDHLLRGQPGPSLVGVAGLAAWLLVLLGAAEAIRIRRERAAEATRIQIRVGLHAGEVELRGNDVGGIAVHIGARLTALASAGDVVVCSTVKDLVAGSGIGFLDLSGHALKGVPGRWRVFAVADPAPG